jgi:hypothetical protein
MSKCTAQKTSLASTWLSLVLVILALQACLVLSGCSMDKQMPDAHEIFDDPKSLAMALAIESSDVVLIEELAQVIDINTTWGDKGMTFLMWAFAQKELPAFKTLLSLGADTETWVDGTSPLDFAMMEDVQWLKPLVEAGINVNQKTESGTPVWFVALSARNWDVIDYLLDNGLDVNAQDSVGYTAIMELAATQQYDQVVKLIDNGADISLTTKTGNSFAYHVQMSTPAKSSPQYRHRQKVLNILQQHGVVLPVPGPRDSRASK